MNVRTSHFIGHSTDYSKLIKANKIEDLHCGLLMLGVTDGFPEEMASTTEMCLCHDVII